MSTYLHVTLQPDDETAVKVIDLTADHEGDLVVIQIGDEHSSVVKLLGTRAELRRVNQLIADGLFALPDVEDVLADEVLPVERLAGDAA